MSKKLYKQTMSDLRRLHYAAKKSVLLNITFTAEQQALINKMLEIKKQRACIKYYNVNESSAQFWSRLFNRPESGFNFNVHCS